MGSIRRWRVFYVDRMTRAPKADIVMANGEPDIILTRLKERYPQRRFQWIEPALDEPPKFG